MIRVAENADDDSTSVQAKKVTEALKVYIEATEKYLNKCTDTAKSLELQKDVVVRLLSLAALDCSGFKPAVEHIDLNGDGDKELILHTNLLTCEAVRMYESGLTMVFSKTGSGGQWHGDAIWPVGVEDKKIQKGYYWDLIESQFRPAVKPLKFRDAKGRRFFALESVHQGGDHSENELTVFRWQEGTPGVVFQLSLSDWCGGPRTWQITNNGKVIVPAIKATERCKARPKKEYSIDEPHKKPVLE